MKEKKEAWGSFKSAGSSLAFLLLPLVFYLSKWYMTIWRIITSRIYKSKCLIDPNGYLAVLANCFFFSLILNIICIILKYFKYHYGINIRTDLIDNYRHIVRIIFIVPVYAIDSWLTLVFESWYVRNAQIIRIVSFHEYFNLDRPSLSETIRLDWLTPNLQGTMGGSYSRLLRSLRHLFILQTARRIFVWRGQLARNALHQTPGTPSHTDVLLDL